MTVTVEPVDDFTTVTTIRDDVSGEIDLTYTIIHAPPIYNNVLVAVTDYDLRGEKPYLTYSETWTIRGMGPILTDVTAEMDDGSTYGRNLGYYGLLDGTCARRRESRPR